MTANPLKSGAQKSDRKVTVAMLRDLADDLNKEPWVERMGRHYFVDREKNPKFKPGSDDPKEREFIHSLAWSG